MLTHWKRPWCWRDWGQEEKGTTEDEMAGWHHWLDGHGFGDSRSWLWTWRPGVLRFMGSQRVGHDWAAELNCIPFKDHKCVYMYYSYYINGVGLLCSCPRCPWTWQNQSLVSVLSSWQSLLIFAPLFHLFIVLTMFLALTGALYWTPFSLLPPNSFSDWATVWLKSVAEKLVNLSYCSFPSLWRITMNGPFSN